MLLGLDIYIYRKRTFYLFNNKNNIVHAPRTRYINIFIEKGIGKELRDKSCKTLLNLIQLFQASHGQETI